MTDEPIKQTVSRRDFLRISGLTAGALTIAGAATGGLAAGADKDTNTGWKDYTYGDGEFFDRKPFFVSKSTYIKAGETRRLNYFPEYLIARQGFMASMIIPEPGKAPKWTLDQGAQALPEPWKTFFIENPDKLELIVRRNTEIIPTQAANWEKFGHQYALADAWSHANESTFLDPATMWPPEPTSAPEVWDFRNMRKEPLEFKSPDLAAELIKKITYSFGAVLVGITKLNPDFVYQGNLRGVGPGDFEVPKHWEYAIVIGVPHEWDSMYANPIYGTSYDAYSRLRMIGGKLDEFIRTIGYPSRAHVPPYYYDLACPPIAIDAGLGQQGRHGLLITPELGTNTRLAVVTTNLPMTVDKPIDIGIGEFCKNCKICAEQCPSGAISTDPEPQTTVRGYRRWMINDDACFNTWASVATSHPRGCRVCLSACPYTRRNNWVHTIAREVSARDGTGLSHSTLTWMQKTFFDQHQAKDFLPPPDGINATFREAPDWLKTENWIK